MSLTLTTVPASHCAVRRPVVIVATSDRYDATAHAHNVTSVTNSGGNARFNFAAAHGFKAGDVLTGSTFTVDAYNVRCDAVTILDAGTFYVNTNLTYTSNDTGICTRTNDNFRLKIGVYVNTVLFATKYAFADASGNFSVDIANIVKDSMTVQDRGIFTLGIETGLTNTIKAVYCYIEEYYDDITGLLKLGDNTTSGTYQVVNGAWQHVESSMASYIVQTGAKYLFLTDIPSQADTTVKIKLKTTEFYNLAFMLKTTMSVKYAYQRFLNGSSISSHVSGTIALTSIFNILTIGNIFGSGDRVDVWISTTGGDQITEKVTFIKDTASCSTEKRIKWRNRRGGYESFTFIDFEENIAAEKTKYKRDLGLTFTKDQRGTTIINSESAIDGELISEYLSADGQEWLQELINSEDVYMIELIANKETEIPIDVLTKEHPINTAQHQQFKIKYQYANEIL